MAADFLTRILDSRAGQIEAARRVTPEAQLIELTARRSERRPFGRCLAVPGPLGANIVAEIKRASPSRGLICGDLDATRQARAYQAGGAAALSVLTEPSFFQGSPVDLEQARSATGLPVLRKDFIISRYQVYEAVCWGADALLLIVRALVAEQLRELLQLCREVRIDALVEVHSEAELDVATAAGAQLIGINNRDLTTFRTDLETSVRLAGRLAKGQVAVAESGIRTREDILRLMDAGIWNFLIGESLVRAPNPEAMLRELLVG
jgi:indole-3-glycerol phosphate synthase